MKKDSKQGITISNKDIGHRYEIIDKIECGISLTGTEVKSIRKSKANLKDSFALIVKNEIILKNMHISNYEQGNINNVPEKRDRKLLVHKEEILKIKNKINQGGYTLVPSNVYLSGRWIKVTLCICKGKKNYDKRDEIKASIAKRQINYFKKVGNN